MPTISRIAGWLLMLSGIAILALIGALWFDGQNIVRAAGQAWSELDPLSLTVTRQLAQEYLGFDAWNRYIAAALQQPTWLALAEMSALTLVLGILFLQLGHIPQTQESDGARLA